MIYLRTGTKIKISEAVEPLAPADNTGHYLFKIKNIDTGKLYEDWRTNDELIADDGFNEIESAIKKVLIKDDSLAKRLKDKFIQEYPRSLKELKYY